MGWERFTDCFVNHCGVGEAQGARRIGKGILEVGRDEVVVGNLEFNALDPSSTIPLKL